MLQNSSYSPVNHSSNSLVVANSSMALSRLSSYVDSGDECDQSISSVWLVSSNPDVRKLPLEQVNIFVDNFASVPFISYRRLQSRITNFIQESGCSTAIFYDFAQDKSIYFIAKLLLALDISICVLPGKHTIMKGLSTLSTK